MAQQLSFTTVIEHAAKLPFVHVNREEFLTKNLSKLCTQTQLQKAIAEGIIGATGGVRTMLDNKWLGE